MSCVVRPKRLYVKLRWGLRPLEVWGWRQERWKLMKAQGSKLKAQSDRPMTGEKLGLRYKNSLPQTSNLQRRRPNVRVCLCMSACPMKCFLFSISSGWLLNIKIHRRERRGFFWFFSAISAVNSLLWALSFDLSAPIPFTFNLYPFTSLFRVRPCVSVANRYPSSKPQSDK